MLLAMLAAIAIGVGGTDGVADRNNVLVPVLPVVDGREQHTMSLLRDSELDALAFLGWNARGMRLALGEAVAGGDIGGSKAYEGLPGREVRRHPSAASQWRWLLCAPGRPWPCPWALATVACESGGDPTAWSTEVVEGVRYYFHGLWQHASLNPEPGRLADPVVNTEIAVSKYRVGGATPWPYCGLAR